MSIMSIDQSIKDIQSFQGGSLTSSLSEIESAVVGNGVEQMEIFCSEHNIDVDFMSSALEIKKLASQINVIIHAAGIIRSLPSLLKPGEKVESVSLGAGNTGRKFDLETNFRVAEYKFIDWQGGSESIRQNGIFKDFFELAEYDTEKEKYLHVVGTEVPIRFFNSRRSIDSVLSKQPSLLNKFRQIYGNSLNTVAEYYLLNEMEVKVCDISPHIGRSA
jgi:hypothetical protein